MACLLTACIATLVVGFDESAALDPELLNDVRLERVRDTDTVFTMTEFASRTDWERFAAELRARILISSGLFPLPERTPLNPHVFDRIEHPDYSVEKVYFEAWPGFLVTGNLYKPIGEGPFPAVLNPHGHWEDGRLENSERGSVPGRCITLARLGMVALSIDMLGYNDSLQFEHRWEDKANKLWGIHPFALQLWSSIRAVDFLESLPYVDPERIGCTGASGGGTQTFALMAVDERIKVAAPVNMISSTMQGGCVCENAPLIRFSNSNMEIGALMAPRPLLLVSATGDWTRETPHVEYPAIRSIYELYGHPERVQNVHIDAGHNYNRRSREAMYPFFRRWLKGDTELWDVSEPPFEVEPPEDLRVFPDGQLPPSTPDKETIIADIRDRIGKKWEAEFLKSTENSDRFQTTFATALGYTLGTSIPTANELETKHLESVDIAGGTLKKLIISRRDVGDAIPAAIVSPDSDGSDQAVLIVHSEGKAAVDDNLVQKLLNAGITVALIDVFLTGDHVAGENPPERRYGKFPDTFHPTNTGYRVQDILTALAFLRTELPNADRTDLVGLGDAGIWCLFAAALDPNVSGVIASGNGFEPDNDDDWVNRHYVPSIRSIGDVKTALALITPRPLYIVDTRGVFGSDELKRYYEIGADARLQTFEGVVNPADLLLSDKTGD